MTRAEEVMDALTGYIATCMLCGYGNYGVKDNIDFTCECGVDWVAIGKNKFEHVVQGPPVFHTWCVRNGDFSIRWDNGVVTTHAYDNAKNMPLTYEERERAF